MGIPASSERKALYRGIRIIDAIHPSREFAINDLGDVDRAKFLCFCNLPYAPVVRRDVWFGEVDQDIRVDKNRHPSLVNARTSSAVIADEMHSSDNEGNAGRMRSRTSQRGREY